MIASIAYDTKTIGSVMAMWKEMPSGREEAIETLVDMDPQGNFFRAARVLVRLSVAFVGVVP